MNSETRSSNNFGALRLLFAIFVILSHSPELIDGDRSRELLTIAFGTLSFGELGVDGFFLISGYLVTKSFLSASSSYEYLAKRVLRIYPGYVVTFLICLLIIGPLVGGQLAALSIASVFDDIVFLHIPEMHGIFSGTPYAFLNGSMWTIAYEFRCYLLVLALGLCGSLSERALIFALTAGGLTLTILHVSVGHWIGQWLPLWRLTPFLGDLDTDVRFFSTFLCGSLFYLYRDSIKYDWRAAAIAFVSLIVFMFFSLLAEAAVVILGGYVLFWFIFNVKSSVLSRIGRQTDLSYGMYLYAWPTQKLLIWLYPGISPWLVFAEATVITSLLALASWWLVEKPFLNLKTAFLETKPLLT